MSDKPRLLLTLIKQREICAILAVGCSRAVAARYVGCSVQTIRRTAEKDAAFAAELEKAESLHEILHLKHINQAAREGRYWRAAAWTLEHRYPERYGTRRPASLTFEQMYQALAQLADVLIAEIVDDALQDRVAGRLSELAVEFHDAAWKKKPQ